MICKKCGGILSVIKVHNKNNLCHDRLCDVQCLDCKDILYYQPYDFGSKFNIVPKSND